MAYSRQPDGHAKTFPYQKWICTVYLLFRLNSNNYSFVIEIIDGPVFICMRKSMRECVCTGVDIIIYIKTYVYTEVSY